MPWAHPFASWYAATCDPRQPRRYKHRKYFDVVIPGDAIDRVVAEVETVTSDLGDELRRGLVQGEDDFTSRLADRIAQRVTTLRVSNVRWDAIKLKDRGRGAQEHEVGADLLAVLSVRSRHGSYAKGFLAQAKLLGVGKHHKRAELAEQVENMLRYSPDSFVFLYDTTGVRVVGSLPVARTTVHLAELPSWKLSELLDAHLRSFVGDERLGATANAPVEVMMREFRARQALELRATIESAT